LAVGSAENKIMTDRVRRSKSIAGKDEEMREE
jgi:hypothetical protein